MKHKVLILFVFSLLSSSHFYGQDSRPLKKEDIRINDIHAHIEGCPSSNKLEPGYIAPAIRKGRNPKFNNEPAVFNITYDGEWPEDHKGAVEFALDILSSSFQSPIEINIIAFWRDLGEFALGSAIERGAVRNFPNAPSLNTWYPMALADKISRENIDINVDDDFDIIINVNSEVEWFTDPSNPVLIGARHDLATVMLHEVIHAIGFTGNARINSGSATVLSSGFGSVFDYELIDVDGDSIISSKYLEGSTELADALTTGKLFFQGKTLDNPAELYTPSDYDPGSSVYHLDPATSGSGVNRLMAPSLPRGLVNHEPGIAIEMLYDMGWDMTQMLHTPELFSEVLTTDYITELEILTDSGFDTTSLAMHYSTDGFATVNNRVSMQLDDNTGKFIATLPAPNAEVEYQYYFEVSDSRSVTRRNPGDVPSLGETPNIYFTYNYGIDNIAPEIQHDDILQITEAQTKLSISAIISDEFAGIDTVVVEIQINSAESETVPMIAKQGSFGIFYEAVYSFPSQLNDGDVINYRISAKDRSLAANESIYPSANTFVMVPVVQVPKAQDFYEVSFDEEGGIGEDFLFTGFDVVLINGFADSTLVTSPQPYPEAGASAEINLVAELKIPIIINADDPSIIFDEIVLVEPGENGSVFGDNDFWDYVIVEGKKYGEEDWLPLMDGYDCTDQGTWNASYINSVNGDNISTALPNELMYVERNLNILESGDFVANDSMFIRFRLFSDEAAAGWGWVMNNLKIQNSTSTVSVSRNEDLEYFQIYPNPIELYNSLSVEVAFLENQSDVNLKIMDLNGRILNQWPITDLQSNRFSQSVDISDYTSGVYLIQLQTSSGISTRKLIIQ